MVELSYLVMTAADAAQYNTTHPHDIVSLNQLLEERSNSSPDIVCVGFLDKQDGKLICNTLTYKRLYEKVNKTAYLLHTHPDYTFQARTAKDAKNSEDGQFVVGLLAPSCEDFLITVFALFRLGWSVLLIAPQNTADDIAGLCKSTHISQLLYHPSMELAAKRAATSSQGSLNISPTLVYAHEHELPEDYMDVRTKLSPEDESETDCIIFHSSGSSGTPKPIPQKHRIWTKAACCKPYPPSFTTTPLFHGGISDLLRSMMSKSTLYMFPSTLPITASNLLQAFEACPQRPTSFLSVPYILEMLSDTKRGLEELIKFDLVSTGGSPLAPQVGDMFVNKGVKLVSRYGSSESGFLMTSFRDFEHDKEWNYLRPSAGKEWLAFEDQGDGLFELIVPKEWPTKNKSNRPDGSYATSDLFRKHSNIEDAWMLCGRSDDVILMSNGEKASPAPLESAIRKSPLVTEALVFGVNRSSLGAAIIPEKEGTTLQDFSPIIQEANKVAPAHAQISPELVILLPKHEKFPKASKGTLQRGKAYDAFASVIDETYKRYESVDAFSGEADKLQLEPSELLEFILERIRETMQIEEVKADDDLFNLGLTSTQALRVRNLLNTKLDLGSHMTLSPNIVYECSTARQLARFITDRKDGNHAQNSDVDLQFMRELVTGNLVAFDATSVAQANGNNNGSGRRTCLLTGGTGSLGAQLISVFMKSQQEWDVICLVRATNDRLARERVLKTLESQYIRLDEQQLSRLTCLSAKLPEDNLGLSAATYEEIAHQVDLIIHAAWPVHFSAGLQSFVPHLQGLRNLIDMALRNQADFYFCSSTAAVLAGSSKTIEERIYTDPNDAVAMGYARSKFVAEAICDAAAKVDKSSTVGILRLGQLSGDTHHGIWKVEEGWPQLFASAGFVGCLPDLDETLNWLPMNKAAQAIVDIVTKTDPEDQDSSATVFHVTSTSHITSYKDVTTMARSAGLRFDLVEPVVWLEKLRNARENGREHSCLKMLDTWERNYGGLSQESQASSEALCFKTEKAESRTNALQEPTNGPIFTRILQYWQSQGLIDLNHAN